MEFYHMNFQSMLKYLHASPLSNIILQIPCRVLEDQIDPINTDKSYIKNSLSDQLFQGIHLVASFQFQWKPFHGWRSTLNVVYRALFHQETSQYP